MSSLIEDENKDGYTIRSDLMKDGDKILCKDDNDMHIQKEGNSVILVKSCFVKNPFIK